MSSHDNHLGVDFISHALVVGCSDGRQVKLTLKHLKRIHGIEEPDVATTAGGSRTLSFYGVGEDEAEEFTIKQQALFLDCNKLIHHKATTGVVACHGLCGYWPEFWILLPITWKSKKEFKLLRNALIKEGKLVRAEYPKMEVWDQEAEFAAHWESLLKAAKVLRSKYPELERIILIYVVLELKKPNRPIKIIEIDPDTGECEEIDLRTDPRMTRHVTRQQ